jgi:phosphoglycolate phosphatase-like HAD superfamily hydrolase
MATYIFDFDGTLADSFSLACDILRVHAIYLGCKQLTTAELLELKNMHASAVLKYLNVPFWRVPSFIRKLRKIVNQHVDEIAIFPEWAGTLYQLSSNHQIGLISSNAYKTVEQVLKKHQIFTLFNFIHCDQSLFGKKRCLNKLLKQRKLDPTTTYYVGDEVRDIEAARAVKIQSIAVSWGFNSVARLKLANPDYLINTIDQINNTKP